MRQIMPEALELIEIWTDSGKRFSRRVMVTNRRVIASLVSRLQIGQTVSLMKAPLVSRVCHIYEINRDRHRVMEWRVLDGELLYWQSLAAWTLIEEPGFKILLNSLLASATITSENMADMLAAVTFGGQ
jgi:hypothetical protein